MATEADFYIRNAKIEDFEEIKKFLTVGKTSYIGPQRRTNECDVENFFRHFATYRLLAFENEDSSTIVAYAEFRNYPYLWALPGEYWLDFLKSHYCLTIPVSATNAIFFNYATIVAELNPALLKNILREVFFREDQLRFILVLEPPDKGLMGYERGARQNYFIFDSISHIYYPRVFSIESCRNTQKLHVISRLDIIPFMTYRKALPEDNDDIIEVIDLDRPDLREISGDYFIAEVLLQPGIQHNLLIVTEIDNQTAGFIWLNDNVDVMVLLENYEVEMFPNLIKFDPYQKHKEIEINVIVLEKKSLNKLFTNEAINEICRQEFIEKFVLHGEFSSFTLSSHHNLRVQSISGIILTTNEHYFIRQEFFQNMTKVSERLQHSAYYSYRFEKTVSVFFNVPKATDSVIDELPDKSNIFAIQLFGMHQNNDIRRLLRLMLASFSAYPDRDYCVFSLPVGTPITNNLRYLLKYFVRMSSRPRSLIQDELYITHRSSLYGEISLHDVRFEDVGAMEKIMVFNLPHLYENIIIQRQHSSINTKTSLTLSYSDKETDIVQRILEDVFNNPYTPYTVKTIRCGRADEPVHKNILVGFVILRAFNKVHLLRPHFQVPKSLSPISEAAEIITMKLHPFYHHHVDLIYRELARLTNYFEYYYMQVMRGNAISLPNDMILRMQPIEPKRLKSISKAKLLPESPPPGDERKEFYQRINYIEDFYAVYHHNLKPIEPCGSDTPLVIIGFSPICKAFLRTYIFNWNVPGATIASMNCCTPQLKVVVITEPGVIEAEYDMDLICPMCKENNKACFIDNTNWCDYVADVTRRMDVRKYVHFVSGRIKRINRDTHHVIFHNDCRIYYDQLLLLCDTSFGFPKHLQFYECYPPNYIQVNNRLDRIKAYHKVNLLRVDLQNFPEKSIVVYGAHLRTFEFIEFLLSHDVEPSHIQLVVPYQKGVHMSQTIFNQPVADERIEVILQDMVRDLGITLHLNMTFSHWILFCDDNNISTVVFDSVNGEKLELELDLFVCFYEVYIDSKMVDVVKHAGLKMNHRNIVVNSDFQTSDPAIYALGNYIEHQVEPNHQFKFVSHKEAAEKLIYKLGIIPILSETPFEPKFSQPHSCEVQLPLDYRTFKVTMPKRYLMNHLDNEFTHSLITYDGTFCRVRLNSFGIVEEIVCVTQRKICFQFLMHFVGRHELLLNNLRARWCHEEIKCFLDYFQEPWTELIMHDKFEELSAENRRILMPLARDCMDLNIERNVRREQFQQFAHDLRIHKKLEQAFLKFVREHRQDLQHPIALPEDFPHQK